MLAIAGGYAIASASAYLFLPLEGQVLLGHRLGWRTLFLVGVVPAVLIAIIRRYVPESPRWLIAHGRIDEALRVVEQLERTAELVPPARPAARVLAPADRAVSHGESLVRAIWAPPYRRRTAALSLYGVAWGFFNFGFLIWLPTLLQSVGYTAAKSAQYAFFLNAVSVPAAFATAWLFERWSTRWTMVSYPLIAGVAMLWFGFLADARLLGTWLLILLGTLIFSTGAALAGLFPPYAAEVYPTPLRGTGAGWATSFSRLGAITGPLVGGALVSAGIGPFGQTAVFGSALFVAFGSLALWGIETRRKRLEEIAV
jgi:putative MFS transporter